MKKPSQSRSQADRFADLNEDVSADQKWQDELQVRWQSFLQRVRVHEMLKCLHGEHRKLQVLREHTDLDEIMQARFAQIGVKRRKRESDELVAEGLWEDERDQESGRDQKENSTAATDDDETRTEHDVTDPKDDNLDVAKEMNAIFLRTQKEEEERMAIVYPNLKRVLADPKYVAKSAVKMFRTRTNINDEEFEEILGLCDDKVEQQALRDAFEEKKNRERHLHNADEKRQMLYDFINSNFFIQFMLITVIVSTVGIFILTFEPILIRYVYPVQVMDSCIIGIFVVEAIFKIMIYKGTYFTKLWNLLDIFIIVVHIVEVLVELITKTLALATELNQNIGFKTIKSLRALRLLRVIKFLPNLQVVVTTVFHSMLSMGSIAVLMSLFIFVFAVLGRGLFFEESPAHFGTIGYAFVTLFQLLTLDDWFELLDVIDTESEEKAKQYWIMFTYLFCYIVIEYFVFLNLFVAVLVDNFQLTLADAAITKQKEALIYLEGHEKYIEMNKPYEEKDVEEEDAKDDLLRNSEYVNSDSVELDVEDYFPTKKGTRENALLEHIFKDLTSIDFEHYLFKRRFSILNAIMDKASHGTHHRWKLQDSTHLSTRNKEVLEQQQRNIF
ncbi:cation channel sperm-associated protein 1 [Folsomia candida]|uniref:Cation channel sperm-associated protein 1 n=1 Tax=Folsomia candida TaxID=158441 RepID=A0A226EKQ5_FOLCA|nr:cation channel sperm-associated protein 1 [Folsomia candida]OXA58285.1 Cation channel sperm-associated protein 1 [Folsomia candida]